LDKIKRLDEQLKARINEQKTARSKLQYKSVDEVDRQIAHLQKQVDSASMKLVDEKKALNDISQLNRQKKSFGGIDEAEKGIADLKAQIAELKKTMDDPEAKALSEKYNAIQKELDDIKAEQDVVYKSINQLRDQRTKLQNEQQEAWQALKAYKDDYFERKRAFRDYENKAYQIRREKQQAERQAYEASKRKAIAAQKLEEASAPAFQDEILTAEGLIRYFDPSAVAAKEVAAPSKFAASTGRTVNDDAFKGMKAVKKDEQEDFFIGGGGKKKKGGKKAAAAAGTSTPAETTSKFNLNIGVLEDLAKVKVDAPSSQADIPKLIETLKEKVSKWKADQDKQTKEVSLCNIRLGFQLTNS
jgi:chromosome segregation ATPase